MIDCGRCVVHSRNNPLLRVNVVKLSSYLRLACVAAGVMGVFSAFLDDPDVVLRGYEAGGEGVATGRHAARFSGGSPGVLHGARTYVLQDENGNIE